MQRSDDACGDLDASREAHRRVVISSSDCAKPLDAWKEALDDFTAVVALDRIGPNLFASDPGQNDRLCSDFADACEYVSGIEGIVGDDGVNVMETVEDIVSFRNGIVLSTGDVELAQVAQTIRGIMPPSDPRTLHCSNAVLRV